MNQYYNYRNIKNNQGVGLAVLRDPLIDSIVEGVIGTDVGPDMRVWPTLVSVISPANGTTITVPDAKSPTVAFR